jgi:hypothetical protein
MCCSIDIRKPCLDNIHIIILHISPTWVFINCLYLCHCCFQRISFNQPGTLMCCSIDIWKPCFDNIPNIILHISRTCGFIYFFTYATVASNGYRSISQGPGYWAMFTGHHGNMRPAHPVCKQKLKRYFMNMYAISVSEHSPEDSILNYVTNNQIHLHLIDVSHLLISFEAIIFHSLSEITEIGPNFRTKT